MFKITSDLMVLCLSCGEDYDGMIVNAEDRSDLQQCQQCNEEN